MRHCGNANTPAQADSDGMPVGFRVTASRQGASVERQTSLNTSTERPGHPVPTELRLLLLSDYVCAHSTVPGTSSTAE
eukprot:3686839-Rhodomonas_salina.1